MKPEFKYCTESGISECKIQNNYGTFIGTANCHPDDFDMNSEKVGCEIAYRRAIINFLKYEKNSIIKPSLKALKQLYYSMKHSKHFNPTSYENKMLQRQIQNWEYDLNTVNNMIATEQKFLKDYIEFKENLYQKLRKQRKIEGGQK